MSIRTVYGGAITVKLIFTISDLSRLISAWRCTVKWADTVPVNRRLKVYRPWFTLSNHALDSCIVVSDICHQNCCKNPHSAMMAVVYFTQNHHITMLASIGTTWRSILVLTASTQSNMFETTENRPTYYRVLTNTMRSVYKSRPSSQSSIGCNVIANSNSPTVIII